MEACADNVVGLPAWQQDVTSYKPAELLAFSDRISRATKQLNKIREDIPV
jgi:hypothetical protein